LVLLPNNFNNALKKLKYLAEFYCSKHGKRTLAY